MYWTCLGYSINPLKLLYYYHLSLFFEFFTKLQSSMICLNFSSIIESIIAEFDENWDQYFTWLYYFEDYKDSFEFCIRLRGLSLTFSSNCIHHAIVLFFSFFCSNINFLYIIYSNIKDATVSINRYNIFLHWSRTVLTYLCES